MQPFEFRQPGQRQKQQQYRGQSNEQVRVGEGASYVRYDRPIGAGSGGQGHSLLIDAS
jgi:hypothetical protein